MKSRSLRSVVARLAVVAGLWSAWMPAAVYGFPPTGACCLPQNVCADLDEVSCESQDGTFIGFDTSCDSVGCDVAAAPLLSGMALLATALLIGGSGWVLLRRRRA